MLMAGLPAPQFTEANIGTRYYTCPDIFEEETTAFNILLYFSLHRFLC